MYINLDLHSGYVHTHVYPVINSFKLINLPSCNAVFPGILQVAYNGNNLHSSRGMSELWLYFTGLIDKNCYLSPKKKNN